MTFANGLLPLSTDVSFLIASVFQNSCLFLCNLLQDKKKIEFKTPVASIYKSILSGSLKQSFKELSTNAFLWSIYFTRACFPRH